MVTQTPTTSELYEWLLGQEPFRCYYFPEETVHPKVLHIDHKLPLSLGGTNSLDNLCVTSSRTNRAKGQFTEGEFKDLVKFYNKWPSAGEYLFSRLLMGRRVSRKEYE